MGASWPCAGTPGSARRCPTTSDNAVTTQPPDENADRPLSQPAVYLRPSITPAVIKTAGGCLLLWVLIELLADRLPGGTSIAHPLLTAAIASAVTHPFLTAAIASAMPFVGWLLFVHARCGIRLDDVGLRDLTTRTDLRWDEIAEIELLAENVETGSKQLGLRFVRIKARDGRAIRFADLSAIGKRRVKTTTGVVQDIPQSGLLLGLIADHTATAALFPPQWIGPPHGGSAAPPMVAPVQRTDALTPPPARPVDADAEVPPQGSPLPAEKRKTALAQRWPLGALILKLLSTLTKPLWVGLKAIKIAPAAVSFGAFAVLLSWEFAAIILVMIGIHECGHVYAMWRCGVRVRGIYFIPFLGGAAVSEGLAKTRWGNAFIQINGPIYGTALAIACLVGFYLTGQDHKLLAAAAGWGALINLFNLLPIMPLDGGRLLGEISHSLHRAAGRYAVLGSLLLGALAAYFLGLGLLWIMVVVGTLEFGRQLSAATQKALMDRLGQSHPLSYEVNEHFSALARPLTMPPSPRAREQARAQFDSLVTEAQLAPMRPWQTAIVTVAYLSLVVILVAIAWRVSHIPGADQAFHLLR